MQQPTLKSIIGMLILLICTSSLFAQQTPGLTVSDNGRYLMYEDGRPFFYMGDTAWELFHRLDREEADQYLENRAAKGFTVIQAVVLAQLGGLNVPNAYGAKPLKNNDPAQPNEAYFEHVDHIVSKAASLGMFVGMLPSWGDKWKQNEGGESGIFTVKNARQYGEYLGERYKDQPVIWILGGDQNIKTDEEAAIIEAMALGLREGDNGAHLITYHPRGPGMSSDFFHEVDWLDFNMFQSSHGARDHDNGLFTRHDYQLKPAKPTLDGEPRYENIMVGFYNQNDPKHLRFDDYDARQAAYFSLLEGACGHTYGHNSIWQMWAPGRDPVIGANVPWYDAMDHAGSFQMKHVRHLFESRPFTLLAPDSAFVLDGPETGGAKIKALVASDSSFAFVYSPRGEHFTVDLSQIQSRSVRAAWYDPRYGITDFIHTGDNTGMQTFTPPSRGRGQDWILILDDATRNFPVPGQDSE
ncbi:glycoside hydrolase family 140 protein [Catalinimonas niigatensis]|uniref:glycoside hydrolase family 140 protein n=1 Tax=Catalinimonas niigatensis TaxID=1397264 RepID=UPI002665473E|nr:glycoside hydrolase family 140 protein [Catalinimonas niigatensis]WPP49083.1 glycoside hydrolase family 140 protein [Catalinimonas niigatensis]